MTEARLTTLLGGAQIGTVTRRRDGLHFTYNEDWRSSKSAMPLSLSMPLASADHGSAPLEAFLWGLLPDNPSVIRSWARDFQISPSNVFGLIAHVGEDCAGAVQFIRSERLEAVTAAGAPEIEWIDEAQIAERLRALRHDESTWWRHSDVGQFSLSGAQPKIALLHHDGRWGIPAGRTPTTHILKPPTADLDGLAENEHICLTLARALGLPAAISEVMRFEDEVAIVVERYDRTDTAVMASASAAEAAALVAGAVGDVAEMAARTAAAAARSAAFASLAETQPILRLHQEDLCQALGLLPSYKYQNEGGPTPERIVELLQTHSSRPKEDIQTFVDALAFNWLIAGTDAHAKNYSLLHGTRGRVRLAPLYDVVSAFPWYEQDYQRLKLAMKVGGQYRFRDVGSRQWRKQAVALHLDEGATLDRVTWLASQIREEIERICEQLHGQDLTHPIVDQLCESLVARAKSCCRVLGL